MDKEILKDVSFSIHESDKIGIVGINGTGKTTLLKTIIGEVDIENGQIFKKNGLKIAYLSQEPIFDNQRTVLEEAIEKSNVENDYEIKSMLSRLGLDNFSTVIGTLSGGEKRRLALAITLVKNCDLLILDEPTNHLDIWMINWLEKFLIKWSKALLLVTHDRYFLERITNKTLDLELGNTYVYDANYSRYLELKTERMEYQLATSRKLQAILKKEAVWASLNPQARSTKSKERMERFYELEHKVKETTQNINDLNQTFSFNSLDTRLGKTTIEINNLSKIMNGKILFQQFSYNVKRFDRLGFVGKNGSGKTTLFKTILGELEKDTGNIVIGQTVKIGYFKQENDILNSNIRIIDYVKQFGEVVDTIDGPLYVSQLLENFLFDRNKQYMSVSSLSGGEKRRLQLLTVLIQNPNILLLDEPTNDLDIYTLELLEDYLEKFKGAVLVISHDRYFLDKVTTHSMIFDDSRLIEYTGLISNYITEALAKKTNKKVEEKKEHIEIPRFTSKEKKEFDTIEEKIMQKEEKIASLKQETYGCGSDYQRLFRLQQEIEENEKELEILYERYEYLNQINDAIEKYKKEKFL
jgi:hypothetical protein